MAWYSRTLVWMIPLLWLGCQGVPAGTDDKSDTPDTPLDGDTDTDTDADADTDTHEDTADTALPLDTGPDSGYPDWYDSGTLVDTGYTYTR